MADPESHEETTAMMPTPILLPLCPSTNNLFATGRGGRRHRTKEYESWIDQAGWFLIAQRPQKYEGKVSVRLEVREPPTEREEDVANREKATLDLLVTHGIIKGDSQRYVRRIILDWANDVEGIRVTVTPWTE